MVDRTAQNKVQWVREPYSHEPMALEWVNREVAVIRLNMINPATLAAFPDAKQLTRAKALIIDLRENSHPQSFSNIAALVFRLTSTPYVVFPAYATRDYPYLFSSSSPESFGSLIQTPDFKHIAGDTLFRPAKDNPPLTLPIAILTGPGTGNGAEHFLMLIKQGSPNLMVFGERTAGATGHSLTTALPGAGKILVNVRYDNYVEDDWFREGFIPDVHVPLDLKSLLNGEDLPLINASRHLLER
jgi:C-terminal processing protease CtpA/Prc